MKWRKLVQTMSESHFESFPSKLIESSPEFHFPATNLQVEISLAFYSIGESQVASSTWKCVNSVCAKVFLFLHFIWKVHKNQRAKQTNMGALMLSKCYYYIHIWLCTSFESRTFQFSPCGKEITRCECIKSLEIWWNSNLMSIKRGFLLHVQQKQDFSIWFILCKVCRSPYLFYLVDWMKFFFFCKWNFTFFHDFYTKQFILLNLCKQT